MWRLVTLFAALIAFLAYRNRFKQTTVAEHRTPSVTVGPELVAFIEAVNSVNSPDDPRYAEAVKALRAQSRSVIQNASTILSEKSDAPFALRHSTILALSALKDASALDLLARVALNPQPLPPKDGPNEAPGDEWNHGSRALETGTILSLDALEAVELLADDGHSDALDVIERAAMVDSNAVRASAFAALRAQPDRQAQLTRALERLPDHLRFLAEFRRMQLEDVPQISDPREQLIDPSIALPAVPPLDQEMHGDAQPVDPEYGAPSVRRS